jgi:hypothetical protein
MGLRDAAGTRKQVRESLENSASMVICVHQSSRPLPRTKNRERATGRSRSSRSKGRRSYALDAEMIGTVRVVHSLDKPLSCGARVWIAVVWTASAASIRAKLDRLGVSSE